MSATRRVFATTVASGLLITGLCVAAFADPIIPGVPTPLDGALAGPTATSTTSASPTATATATATSTATATATATGTPAPSTLDAEGLFLQPRYNCAQYTDAAGDAATNPVSGGLGDNDDDLDIKSVAYKTLNANLQVFIAVAKLDQAPTSLGGTVYDTHSYSTSFTAGGKAIVLTAGESGPATAKVGGTANTLLKPTATFDIPHSNVVFTLSRTDLATVVGAPVTALTGLAANSAASSSLGVPGFGADAAAPAATSTQKTYSVGDNTCFTPLPALLTLTTTNAVYTDLASVTATLKTADGAYVGNGQITLEAPGRAPIVARTNSIGIAAFIFRNGLRAGDWVAHASFPGTPLIGPASVSAPFVVTAESTVLSAVATAGAITATLTDNDKAPVGKRYVTFTVAGRRYNVLTDYNGHAVKKLAKGTVATISFAGVPSLYAPAKTLKLAAK